MTQIKTSSILILAGTLLIVAYYTSFINLRMYAGPTRELKPNYYPLRMSRSKGGNANSTPKADTRVVDEIHVNLSSTSSTEDDSSTKTGPASGSSSSSSQTTTPLSTIANENDSTSRTSTSTSAHTTQNDKKIYQFIDDPELLKTRDQCGDNLLVVNIHVPKTGGSTVSEALRRCAEVQGKHFAYGHVDSFFDMPHHRQNGVMAIDAHMGYGIHLQPNFPRHRQNCTVYVTTVRPYIEIIQSAYRYSLRAKKQTLSEDPVLAAQELVQFQQKYTESDIYPGKVSSILHSWKFLGSITYQYCCYHDMQHQISDYDASGIFISGNNEKLRSYLEQDIQQVDPNCPATFEERLQCAKQRLCHDFSLVGELSNPRSAGNFFHQLETLLQCKGAMSDFIPEHYDDGKGNHAAIFNKADWPPFDGFSMRLIHDYLKEEGSSSDAAIMEMGRRVAAGRKEFCSDPW